VSIDRSWRRERMLRWPEWRQRRSATDKVCSVTSYLAQYLLSQSLFTTATVKEKQKSLT
jgi:hypothetical protein